MNCTGIDIKAYLLGELSESARRSVRQHLSGCANCGAELQRLEATQAALLALADEEIPRRIAFVSDKVFEPNWWQRFWQSGPRLVFASSLMLCVTLLWFGLSANRRPAPVAVAPPDPAAIEARVRAEVARRVDAAVRQAVAQSEDRMRKQTADLLAAAEQRMEMERRADLLQVEENLQVLRKRMNILLMASAETGAAQ